MRRLAEPQVLKSAVIAALISAVLCAPRLAMWPKRPYPLWYAEAVLFFCSIVLWAFVFAWHTEYSGRPVFTLKWKPPLFAAATLAGMVAAIGMFFLVDPAMRLKVPEDYPHSLAQWLAMTLFSFGCSQLVLLFAPLAWLIRLVRNRRVAMTLTVALGVIVWALKVRTLATPLPPLLLLQVLAVRITGSALVVWFYLRGGAALVWWIGLLM